MFLDELSQKSIKFVANEIDKFIVKVKRGFKTPNGQFSNRIFFILY